LNGIAFARRSLPPQALHQQLEVSDEVVLAILGEADDKVDNKVDKPRASDSADDVRIREPVWFRALVQKELKAYTKRFSRKIGTLKSNRIEVE
jgi:hypothetical protein